VDVISGTSVSFRQRWIRRALFQIHLWTGIGAGLYVVVICVTGSVLVFRFEVYSHFRPGSIVAPRGERLSQDALSRAALRAYPGRRVTRVQIRRRPPNSAAEVYLDGPGEHLHRLFDPYTGADLGDAEPRATQIFERISDLHDNLLGGKTGRLVNGVGAICLTMLCVSGMVVWWPGVQRWRRALVVQRSVGWKRFNFDLHGALGFWTVVFVLMWATSGVYLVFPQPFQAIADALPQQQGVAIQIGDSFLAWFSSLHFGRFAGLRVKILWAALGLVPPVLFVTGVIMWWNRVLKDATRISRRQA
jgi:uncharacterized iron-regulated membrane protein